MRRALVRVSLFIPCLTDQVFPATGMNMVKVLERLGIAVKYDKRQTCCGQPAFNSGYHEESRGLAERFLDIFEDDGADYIVVPSGSCASMVTVFYGNLLELAPEYQEKAGRVRSRMHEFTSFLVDILHVEDVGAAFSGSVTVHDSCHALRELHIKEQPRRLLRKVRGLELIEMDAAEVCCGFGGTFAVKHADISSAMAEEKVQSIMRSGADVVTGVDSSCLMNIEGVLRRQGLPVRTMHIADILAMEAV
jgi:L-lactate dehydrogenase complex protein LldE